MYRATDLFDEQAYLTRNPDVAAAVRAGYIDSGFQHFMQHGAGEGRKGTSLRFSPASYLALNTDVAAAGFNPGQHYIEFGAREGRGGGLAGWNELDYLRLNPDIARAVRLGVFTSGLDHFAQFGVNENRTITDRPDWPPRPPGLPDLGFVAYADLGERAGGEVPTAPITSVDDKLLAVPDSSS